jgi:hypothetical protein
MTTAAAAETASPEGGTSDATDGPVEGRTSSSADRALPPAVSWPFTFRCDTWMSVPERFLKQRRKKGALVKGSPPEGITGKNIYLIFGTTLFFFAAPALGETKGGAGCAGSGRMGAISASGPAPP